MKHLSFLLLVIMLLATAQVAFAVVLESGIPGGAGVNNKGLAAGTPIDEKLGVIQYIRYLYLFILGFVGIAGLVTLVIWGTVWTASGVIDKKAMAMEGIKNTLMGLGIAFSAYLILFTINPDLTVIRLPPVTPVTIEKTKSTPTHQYIWGCPDQLSDADYNTNISCRADQMDDCKIKTECGPVPKHACADWLFLCVKLTKPF